MCIRDSVNIVPNTTVNETDFDDNIPDPDGIPGRITSRNTGLRPWTADNYDVSLEYYTDQGGTFTAGVFRKDIRDFFASDIRIATEADTEQLGLEPHYIGFQMTTKINAGDARVSGAELSMRHSLAPLGQWGRHFSIFANATKLELKGDRQADFSGFIKNSSSWGITFDRSRLTLMAKWNWRGKQKGTAITNFGPEAYNYSGARTHLDLNCDYQFSKRMSVFLNARNVFDIRTVSQRYSTETPDYARRFSSAEYGVQLGAGVRGAF